MKLLALALPALLLSRCGPSHQETGEAVLMAWPAVVLVALLFHLGYLAIWRARHSELTLAWIPMLSLFGVSLAVGIATFINGSHGGREWAPFAVWAFGASYLTVLLVVTRVWLFFDRTYVLIGPHVVASTLFCGVATFAALNVTEHWLIEPEVYFLFPGMAGAITLPLYLILIIEVVIQIAIARRRARSAAPAATTAAPS